ncbi:MAG: hypothetical protein AAF789_01050 [Bacteroidota bacterium]
MGFTDIYSIYFSEIFLELVIVGSIFDKANIMKAFKLTILIALFSTSRLYGQDSLNLSVETQTEYKRMIEQVKEFESIFKPIMAIGAFQQILGDNSIDTAIKLSNTDWDLYASAAKGFSSLIHQTLARDCGANALSKEISKTADDRKFWQRLYEFHTKYK